MRIVEALKDWPIIPVRPLPQGSLLRIGDSLSVEVHPEQTLGKIRPLRDKVRELPLFLRTPLNGEAKQPELSPGTGALVGRASKGDGEAFGQLYKIYYRRLCNYIDYKTNHSIGAIDAEDLTQEVFIKAWGAIGRFRFEGKPFGNWLIKIAGNVVIDHYRTRKSLTDLSEVIGARAHGGDPEAFVQRRETGQILMSAISMLTDKQRQVILLKFIDGMDNTEISGIMGKKEGAIRALKYRALLTLQSILQDKRYGLDRVARIDKQTALG